MVQGIAEADRGESTKSIHSSQNMAVKWNKTALANLIATRGEYIEKDCAERAKSFALEIQAKTNSLAEIPSMVVNGQQI